MKKVYIIGSGGHANVIANAAKALNLEVIYIIEIAANIEVIPKNAIGEADFFQKKVPDVNFGLICGLGSVASMQARRNLIKKYQSFSNHFVSIVDPKAIVEESVMVSPGVFIAAGAVVSSNVVIGEHVIINTGSIVDHDTKIGSNVHIATGAVVAGGVTIENDVMVGCGSTLIQGVTIGSNTIIGAAAAVVKNIPANSGTWVGVPAKKVRGL